MENSLNNLTNVSRETIHKLELYSDLILKWNEKINLVSNRITKDELIKDHILDSAQLINFIEDKNSLIVDVGSGAGFPGLVLDIMGCTNCKLVEIITKKAVFLKSAVKELALKSEVINDDVKKVRISGVKFIVSRAVTSVKNLVEMTEHLMADETQYLLLKSKEQSKNELKDLEKNWKFELQVHQNIYKTEGVVLLISKLSKK